jgi:hypothetical protein
MHKMILKDFLGCLKASTSCVDHGKTVYLLDKVCTKGIMDIVVL